VCKFNQFFPIMTLIIEKKEPLPFKKFKKDYSGPSSCRVVPLAVQPSTPPVVAVESMAATAASPFLIF
jgi:hypothetical protein